MISLWVHLDRVRTLIAQIEEIINEDNFIENGTLSSRQRQNLPTIHKGLCDEYIRITELIVKKNPTMSMKTIERLSKQGKLKTDWQKQQFINLITIDEVD